MRYLDRNGVAQFADKLMRAIREAGGTGKLRFDATGCRIVQFGDGEAVMPANVADLCDPNRRPPRALRPDFLQGCARAVLNRQRKPPEEFGVASGPALPASLHRVPPRRRRGTSAPSPKGLPQQ